ncbi:AIM24 family protein [Clostridium fallax]|uniref:Uncharacterized conserved protein, AIM24 family n=1 Tax=Clostridium fallax TaxID=1533 RepID=A0A1M4TV91_9CLOT|nr:AIM24 family protein [Clostridium fallax]SHE48392.1 Uncharacterized conserved protein, AIM24 family [Clostridium fallax]SQB22375.1 HTH DNA-binding protein [Clostridium fallax]
MITSLNITNKLTVLSEMKGDSTFQVLQFDELKGGKDIDNSIKLKFMSDAGIRLKQVRVILDNSSVRLEPGALSYLRGDIQIKNKLGGVVGIGKKIFSSKVTGESIFNPLYKGTGELYLEPSFGHFALIELDDEEIIIDDGLFYACEDTIEIGATMQKSISSMFLGDEGVFQCKLSGSGIAVLNIPIPENEIFKCKLFEDTLKVDGNFALLRTGDIEFTVEKAARSITTSATSGEGFLNVYRGTGEVWLAPTQAIYKTLKNKGLKTMADPKGKSHTEV